DLREEDRRVFQQKASTKANRIPRSPTGVHDHERENRLLADHPSPVDRPQARARRGQSDQPQEYREEPTNPPATISCAISHCSMTTNSVLRFFFLFSSESFGTSGRDSPKPRVCRR